MNSKLKFGLIPAVTMLVLLGLLWLAGGFEEEYRLYALDARNGRVAWSVPFPDVRNIGDPIVVDNTVVIERVTETDEDSYQRTVIGVAATDGDPKWAYRSAPYVWNDYGAPELYLEALTGSGHLLIGSEQAYTSDYHIQIVDIDTGTPQWSFAHAFLGDGSWHEWSRNIPVVRDQMYLVSREDFHNVALQARDIHTGAVRWQTPLHISGYDLSLQTVTKPYLISAENLLFHNVDTELRVYVADTGTLQTTLPVAQFSSLGRGQGAIFICSDGLHKVSVPGQEEIWHYAALPFANSNCEVSVAETAVFAIFDTPIPNSDENDGWLVALDQANGRERWRTKLNASSGFFNSTLAWQTPIHNDEFVFAVGGEWDATEIRAFGQADGRLHWTFTTRPGVDEIVTNGDLIFFRDRSPRWRNWLAYLIPAWH